MKWFKFIVFPIIFYAYTSLVFADVIKVGTMIFYPPFVMSVNQGFDVDLIQSLCRRTNLQCQMVPMDFNKIFGALDSGAIDVAIGGIVITPERLNRYIFTTPYLLSKGEFLTLQDNNLQSITGLKGKSVGVIRGEQDEGVFYNYLNTNYADEFQIKAFDDIADVLTALSNKEIAAAFVHESTAIYWQQNGGGQFQLLGPPTIIGEGMGIMALPKNINLIQQFNQQLQIMENDGTYINLYSTYLGNVL